MTIEAGVNRQFGGCIELGPPGLVIETQQGLNHGPQTLSARVCATSVLQQPLSVARVKLRLMAPSPLRTIELRYVLLLALRREGTMTVPELVAEIQRQHLVINGRPSKAISDALRTDVKLGRLRHQPRGPYHFVDIPRGTQWRMDNRVAQIRAAAAHSVAQLPSEGDAA